MFLRICIYGLAQALKGWPLGIIYAIWAGLGIVLATLVGVVVFKQRLDLIFQQSSASLLL
ncbi:MAG TPA: SMR family transporter [Pseudomonas sp.]|nr:SMR family transporter [Pseudomonas sp.]